MVWAYLLSLALLLAAAFIDPSPPLVLAVALWASPGVIAAFLPPSKSRRP